MNILSKVTTKEAITYLTPGQFEQLCKILLPYFGYSNAQFSEKHGLYDADDGIDILCKKNGDSVYIQCKALKPCTSYTFTPVRFIRELGGCMLRDNLTHGVFFSTLPYSNTGIREASKLNIRLLHIGHLWQAIEHIRRKDVQTTFTDNSK